MLGKPGLSFSENEEFADLVRAVIDAKKITVLCGAGVSMDAGLPSWSALIRRIADTKKERGDPLADLLAESERDLLRSAGLLLRDPSGSGTPEIALIADALYRGRTEVPGAYLARQIATFAGANPSKIAIATFNYDDLIEEALREQDFDPVPCSLDAGLEDWWDGFDEPEELKFRVLHLHGYIGHGDASTLSPVVLAEDQFRRHGAKVQQQIADILRRSDLVIGLGLSLTDPNLMGPLGEVEDRQMYLTSVATKVANATPDQSEQLTIKRSEYLTSLFGVKVVGLNSFAQVGQLMVELELALSRPGAYRSSSSRHCIRYGYRLRRSLDRAYSLMGWPSGGTAPTDQHLQRASDALHGVLEELRPQLIDLVMDHNSDRLRALSRLLAKSDTKVEEQFATEGLGCFLWMPTRFSLADKKTQRPYQLQLVGASAYSHRAYWSFRREPVDVDAYATESQARAAFSGRPVVEPTRVVHEPRLWKTNIAVPVLVQPPDQSATTVPVGAMVIASDRPLPGAGDDARIAYAAISYLGKAAQTQYCQLIADAASALLAGRRPGR